MLINDSHIEQVAWGRRLLTTTTDSKQDSDRFRLSISFSSSSSAIVDQRAINRALAREIGRDVIAHDGRDSMKTKSSFKYDFSSLAQVGRSATRTCSNAFPSAWLPSKSYWVPPCSQLDATASAIISKIEGQVGTGALSHLADFCSNCTVKIEGFSRYPSGVKLICMPPSNNSSTLKKPRTYGLKVIAVQHLCNGSEALEHPHPLTDSSSGVTSSIDESWQWPTIASHSGEPGGCSAPVTGCQQSGWQKGQNLISRICLTGGWYVDWMQITWLDGTQREYGIQNSDVLTCMTIASDFGGESASGC